MPKKICRDCKKEFEAKPKYNSRYPQKYCEKCAKERRKAYENIHNVTATQCEEE